MRPFKNVENTSYLVLTETMQATGHPSGLKVNAAFPHDRNWEMARGGLCLFVFNKVLL